MKGVAGCAGGDQGQGIGLIIAVSKSNSKNENAEEGMRVQWLTAPVQTADSGSSALS